MGKAVFPQLSHNCLVKDLLHSPRRFCSHSSCFGLDKLVLNLTPLLPVRSCKTQFWLLKSQRLSGALGIHLSATPGCFERPLNWCTGACPVPVPVCAVATSLPTVLTSHCPLRAASLLMPDAALAGPSEPSAGPWGVAPPLGLGVPTRCFSFCVCFRNPP